MFYDSISGWGLIVGIHTCNKTKHSSDIRTDSMLMHGIASFQRSHLPIINPHTSYFSTTFANPHAVHG